MSRAAITLRRVNRILQAKSGASRFADAQDQELAHCHACWGGQFAAPGIPAKSAHTSQTVTAGLTVEVR
jgi:hypothetical protein